MPQKDAARQFWKAAAAQGFSTASQLTDIHRLAHAPCGRRFFGPLKHILAVPNFQSRSA
jgi:hypothetical protein